MSTNDPTQPQLTRRQIKRQETIDAILDTARDIMQEDGVAALSMHEIARRIGIKTPSLYNYFGGLMDIYDALFRLGFEQWGTHVDAYVGDVETWQERIRLAMEAYLTFASSNPDLYQLCFERPVPGFTPSEESLTVSFGQLNEVYSQIAGLKEQINTDLPPQQIADLVIAMMHGLTALHMANQPDLPLGQGRFGSLIPAALDVLDRAWRKPDNS